MSRLFTVLVVVAIVLGAMVVPTGAQAQGKEAHSAMAAGSIDHLEPSLWYFASTWRLAFATCTPLVTFPDKQGEDGKQVVAGLADLPEVSADGLTYTFALKPGVKFADGKEITGEDIKYTFERIFNPALASPATGFFTVIEGAADFGAGKAQSISGITVDGNKVSFKLTGPMPSFLKRMTMPFTCPVPKGTPPTAFENGENLITGPFMVEKYEPNRVLVLKRNPNYDPKLMNRPITLDRITIDIGVEPAQAGLMLRANQLDVYIENLTAADAAQVLTDPSLEGRVQKSARGETLYFFLNNIVPPFDNVKVRQAVNYAINRNALLRVWGGPSQGAVTDQVLPPTMSGWADADNYPMAGDPEKAKALLAESGLTLPIKTTIKSINDQAGYKEVLQAIQAQLKDVGIDAEIELMINSSLYAQITSRDAKVPAALVMWSQDYPDPDNFIDTLLDGSRITETMNQNFANFNAPDVVAEIKRLATLSGAERDAGYMVLDQRIIRDYAPWAPILNPVRIELISERVTDFVIHPVYGPDIAAMSIK